MPTPTDIRQGIDRAAQKRKDGERLFAEGTQELREWLQAAQESDEITMSDAAKHAGIARVSAYEIVAGRKYRDRKEAG